MRAACTFVYIVETHHEFGRPSRTFANLAVSRSKHAGTCLALPEVILKFCLKFPTLLMNGGERSVSRGVGLVFRRRLGECLQLVALLVNPPDGWKRGEIDTRTLGVVNLRNQKRIGHCRRIAMAEAAGVG